MTVRRKPHGRPGRNVCARRTAAPPSGTGRRRRPLGSGGPADRPGPGASGSGRPAWTRARRIRVSWTESAPMRTCCSASPARDRPRTCGWRDRWAAILSRLLCGVLRSSYRLRGIRTRASPRQISSSSRSREAHSKNVRSGPPAGSPSSTVRSSPGSGLARCGMRFCLRTGEAPCLTERWRADANRRGTGSPRRCAVVVCETQAPGWSDVTPLARSSPAERGRPGGLLGEERPDACPQPAGSAGFPRRFSTGWAVGLSAVYR